MDFTGFKKILAETLRYQTHTWKGEVLNQGIRGNERRQLVLPADLQGRRVLDLGCASGAECFWALEQGASSVCGVEVHTAIAGAAQRLVLEAGLQDRITILSHDLRQGLPSEILAQTWDTVFAFAILQHAGQRRFWETVPGATVAYVESGAPCSWDSESLTQKGWQATLRGRTPNNAKDPRKFRKLFRLEKS